MKIKEIKGLEGNALQEKVTELRKELVKINAQVALGTAIKNPGQVKQMKKTLARIYTIQHERESKKHGQKKMPVSDKKGMTKEVGTKT